mgnify:CR=1 FL=1
MESVKSDLNQIKQKLRSIETSIDNAGGKVLGQQAAKLHVPTIILAVAVLLLAVGGAVYIHKHHKKR